MWKKLGGDPKRQNLTRLQRELDNTAWRLSICVIIVVTPGMIKFTLVLGFRL